MSEPAVAAKFPIVAELTPGQSYYWCQCGKSANQPWCDGSHAGSEFSPKEFQVTEAKKYALCQCKATAGGPFCDGSHKKL